MTRNEKVIDMYKSGCSSGQIAETLGYSRQTISSIINKANLPTRYYMNGRVASYALCGSLGYSNKEVIALWKYGNDDSFYSTRKTYDATATVKIYAKVLEEIAQYKAGDVIAIQPVNETNICISYADPNRHPEPAILPIRGFCRKDDYKVIEVLSPPCINPYYITKKKVMV